MGVMLPATTLTPVTMTAGLAVYLTMRLAVPLAICTSQLLWLLALLSVLMLASEMATLSGNGGREKKSLLTP